MTPYYEDEAVTIYHGDCRDVLPDLAPVETCITDPPYGLAFMGKAWDHAVPDETYWRLVLDAVKPGGSLLAFGGTRLWHWLAVGIEQAGWEIRDTLMWLYGSGFPKSLDISKAIDGAAGAEREVVGRTARCVGPSQKIGHVGSGTFRESLDNPGNLATAPATDAAKLWNGWGTALKPAWEPIVLAMKPLDGTFAGNAEKHGVAGLNVDGARIPTDERALPPAQDSRKSGASSTEHYRMPNAGAGGGACHDSGRWPANLALDEEAARTLDEQAPEAGGGFVKPYKRASHDYYSGSWPDSHGGGHDMGGGASRFFYTSKASRADRGPNNDHPTVKPSDLMKWLCTLTATPTGGTVLDPFMGSGTTLYAAKETGRKAIGIELEERYCEIAAQRCMQGVLDLGGAA